MKEAQSPLRPTLGSVSKSRHQKALSWQPCSQLPSNQEKGWNTQFKLKDPMYLSP